MCVASSLSTTDSTIAALSQIYISLSIHHPFIHSFINSTVQAGSTPQISQIRLPRPSQKPQRLPLPHNNLLIIISCHILLATQSPQRHLNARDIPALPSPTLPSPRRLRPPRRVRTWSRRLVVLVDPVAHDHHPEEEDRADELERPGRLPALTCTHPQHDVSRLRRR